MSCGNCVNCSNKCDVCLNCDGTNKNGHASLNQCNNQQTYCTGSRLYGQNVSSYVGPAGAPALKKDDIIIKAMSRGIFNNLFKYVLMATQHRDINGKFFFDGLLPEYIRGPRHSEESDPLETRDFVYSDKVRALLTMMKDLAPENTIDNTTVAIDKVIYGTFFNNIMTKINNLKINTQSCPSCVSSCNTSCNTCDTCDSCISCNSCQSVSSYGVYYPSW